MEETTSPASPPDALSLSQTLREYRHNRCLMSPLSVLMFLVLCLFSLVTLLLHIPEFVLGLLLAPVLQRGYYYIEFLYPTGIVRWAHFFLMKMSSNNINNKDAKNLGHSRSIEQRVEVVKGRVFIHSIPQLVDNIGYLVVCCPPPTAGTDDESSQCATVAFLVDCGDAQAVMTYIESIRDIHYPDAKMELHSLLCTHKHHDHTAGNGDLLKDEHVGKTLKRVYGGAVERVPHCNRPLADGEFLSLPRVIGNDMNDLVQVEAIAVPCHTRGSLVFSLRSKSCDVAYMFTGDTMFSGGGGVPFEADTELRRDKQLSRKMGNSAIKAMAGSNAVERCFAEILTRGVGSEVNIGDDAGSRILIFPGHEYTSDLLSRQFMPQSSQDDSYQWNKLPPSVFFEVASQLYVTNHRRTLPKTGKLLTVPSLMSRELNINPHLRNMKKRGQHVIHAIQLWHHHFAKGKIPIDDDEGVGGDEALQNGNHKGRVSDSTEKTPSTSTTWNMSASDYSRPVFTTVYASDLDSIIADLHVGRISSGKAAQLLTEAKSKLDTPTVVRRPLPGTLPTEKSIYLGVLGLALLGSPPSAMTLSDSRTMKMPAPVEYSDRILISKKRLISVLNTMGLLTDDLDGRDLLNMIHLLWKEAEMYNGQVENKPDSLTKGKSNDKDTDLEATATPESQDETDEVELEVLRWMLYGVEMNQPSWFSKFCMPCGVRPEEPPRREPHPVHKLDMRRSQGELVRHDIITCPLCRDSLGCPLAEDGEVSMKGERSRISGGKQENFLVRQGSTQSRISMPSDEEHCSGVEVWGIDEKEDTEELEAIDLQHHPNSVLPESWEDDPDN